ncbi:unnamed protein product [Owenia fusiformis]|uniref:C2H2-type domain-containing protein n=1 Tax=Owenia fusiformis TaxID=6347 RepID=A0A8S4NPC8_OWEFU|nr:unnamed protein product [Owenia fusiformis]
MASNIQYDCANCAKSFDSSKKLLQHDSRVHGPTSHQCILCKRIFKRLDALRRHQATCPGIGNEEEDNFPITPVASTSKNENDIGLKRKNLDSVNKQFKFKKNKLSLKKGTMKTTSSPSTDLNYVRKSVIEPPTISKTQTVGPSVADTSQQQPVLWNQTKNFQRSVPGPAVNQVSKAQTVGPSVADTFQQQPVLWNQTKNFQRSVPGPAVNQVSKAQTVGPSMADTSQQQSVLWNQSKNFQRSVPGPAINQVSKAQTVAPSMANTSQQPPALSNQTINFRNSVSGHGHVADSIKRGVAISANADTSTSTGSVRSNNKHPTPFNNGDENEFLDLFSASDVERNSILKDLKSSMGVQVELLKQMITNQNQLTEQLVNNTHTNRKRKESKLNPNHPPPPEKRARSISFTLEEQDDIDRDLIEMAELTEADYDEISESAWDNVFNTPSANIYLPSERL